MLSESHRRLFRNWRGRMITMTDVLARTLIPNIHKYHNTFIRSNNALSILRLRTSPEYDV